MPINRRAISVGASDKQRGERVLFEGASPFGQGMDREVPLVPGQLERYDIDLWFTSRVFQPGHRLRVSIASALFPK